MLLTLCAVCADVARAVECQVMFCMQLDALIQTNEQLKIRAQAAHHEQLLIQSRLLACQDACNVVMADNECMARAAQGMQALLAVSPILLNMLLLSSCYQACLQPIRTHVHINSLHLQVGIPSCTRARMHSMVGA